jgi:hypothetical protein
MKEKEKISRFVFEKQHNSLADVRALARVHHWRTSRGPT